MLGNGKEDKIVKYNVKCRRWKKYVVEYMTQTGEARLLDSIGKFFLINQALFTIFGLDRSLLFCLYSVGCSLVYFQFYYSSYKFVNTVDS